MQLSKNYSYLALFLKFCKFGCLAWGGPIAQIAMLKRELVTEEKWVSEDRFLKALALYQALPGPEAHELCVYFGTVKKGRLGGILAGLGFMLPGLLLMLGLAWLYTNLSFHSQLITALSVIVYPTILAVISAALKRIASHSLHSLGAIVAGLLACTLELASVPFWISLLLAALIVEIASRGQKKLAIGGAISFGLVAIWYTATQSAGAAHVAATQIASGHVSILDLSWIGLKAGLLTFGGAYTVIPFLEADAVHSYAWITQAQFMDGIALGGMIPAPLVIFASFLGWLGGGFFGALAITFGIFLPAFLFTLLGHEVFERLMEHRSLQRLLEGVAAGVVGIMAATVLEFYQHLITSYQAALICALSLLLLLKFKWKYTAPALILVNTTLAVMVSL